jgi:hypothetical protein
MKSSLNQANNSVESLSSRLNQVEDRMSGPEDKVDIIVKSGTGDF